MFCSSIGPQKPQHYYDPLSTEPEESVEQEDIISNSSLNCYQTILSCETNIRLSCLIVSGTVTVCRHPIGAIYTLHAMTGAHMPLLGGAGNYRIAIRIQKHFARAHRSSMQHLKLFAWLACCPRRVSGTAKPCWLPYPARRWSMPNTIQIRTARHAGCHPVYASSMRLTPNLIQCPHMQRFQIDLFSYNHH